MTSALLAAKAALALLCRSTRGNRTFRWPLVGPYRRPNRRGFVAGLGPAIRLHRRQIEPLRETAHLADAAAIIAPDQWLFACADLKHWAPRTGRGR